MMTIAPGEVMTTPIAWGNTEAAAHLEEAMALVRAWMPEAKRKTSVLHRIGLEIAQLRQADSRRVC
jgi:hypothetical protein